MLSKWKIDIEGYEKYRFGEDKILYRLPFIKGGKSYGLKKVIFNPDTKRWTLNGKPWSKDKLSEHIIIDDNPVILTRSDEMPF